MEHIRGCGKECSACIEIRAEYDKKYSNGVEWVETELRVTSVVTPGHIVIEKYREAMKGRTCLICGEGFPKVIKTTNLPNGYLDKHVEWVDETKPLVHRSCQTGDDQWFEKWCNKASKRIIPKGTYGPW